jgi:hypothetical protein
MKTVNTLKEKLFFFFGMAKRKQFDFLYRDIKTAFYKCLCYNLEIKMFIVRPVIIKVLFILSFKKKKTNTIFGAEKRGVTFIQSGPK